MPERQLGQVARQIGLLFNQGTVTGLSDSELLEHFTTDRDEAAFEALVHRHGPTVLAVCRDVLKDPHDAQDAFQTTFLVLVRKARSLWVKNGSLGSWLYRVAYRIAIKANGAAARRRLVESQGAKLEYQSPFEGPQEALIPALHEEIEGLPEKYRAPIVLCHLERLTHAEAARQLDWTEGMIRGRVARGRDLLARRLARRGLTLSAAALAHILPRQTAEAAVPRGWIDATVAEAVSTVAAPAGAVATTAEFLRKVLLTRIWTSPALAAAVILGGVVGVAGTRLLAPNDDIEARALALAIPLDANAAGPMAKPDEPRAPDWGARGTRHNGAKWEYKTWRGAQVGWVPFGVHNIRLLFSSTDEKANGDFAVTIIYAAVPSNSYHFGSRPVLFHENLQFEPEFEHGVRGTRSNGFGTAIDRFRLPRKMLPPDAVPGTGAGWSKWTMTLLDARNKAESLDRANQPPPQPVSGRHLEPAQGRSWAIEPRILSDGDWSAANSGADQGVTCDVLKTRRGTLVFHVAYRADSDLDIACEIPAYRPVFFDAQGNRNEIEDDRRSRLLGVMPVFEFEVPAPPNEGQPRGTFDASQVAFIGVERLSASTLREDYIRDCLGWLGPFVEVLEIDERRLSVDSQYEKFKSDDARDITRFPSAGLGLYEILRTAQGRPNSTGRILRDARIAAFRKFTQLMRIGFPRSPNGWPDIRCTFGARLLREQSAEPIDQGDFRKHDGASGS